jgi:hypothetical protein
MSKIEWNRPEEQTFEAGLDRGVLYCEGGPAVPWNGLTSVDDDGDATIKELYLDGVKYLSVVSARDWKGKLSAYTYPEEFNEVMGVGELGDGLYIDSQAPQRFGLSYRTMVSAPAIDERPQYKIHIIYKAMAALSGFGNETLSDNIKPTEFEFNLSAVPIQIPDNRPTAHIILDTRKLDSATLASLETMLYGDDVSEPSLPAIDDLINLLKFPDTVTVVYNEDGTWTATGSNDNVYMIDMAGHFQIDSVNAVYTVPDEIYEFPDLGDLSIMSVVLDEDGIPYVGNDIDNDTNVGEDEDGAPYYEDNEADMSLHVDTDGAYYFEDLTP